MFGACHTDDPSVKPWGRSSLIRTRTSPRRTRRPPRPAEYTCDVGWTGLGDRCYMRHDPADYDTASATCESRGAHLAVPNTEAENTFLASGVMNSNRQSYTWLGFDYDDAERWSDGSPSSMSASWRPLYQVDDAADRTNGEPAVFIRANGAWSFENKDQSYPFICEVAAPLRGASCQKFCDSQHLRFIQIPTHPTHVPAPSHRS